MSLKQHELQEQDERIEVIDLGLPASAGSGGSRWLSLLLLDVQRNSRRRHWRAGCWLAGVLLSITFTLVNTSLFAQTAALLPHPVTSSASARPATGAPWQEPMTDLVDAAWSPDAHFIAVLGYHRVSEQGLDVPAVVKLYDLHSRQVKRQFSPDGAIIEALSGSVPPSQTGRIDQEEALSTPIVYTHVLWSPDGGSLALTFSILSSQPTTHGVVLLNRDGAELEVLLTRQALSAPFSLEWQFSSPVGHLSERPAWVPADFTYEWQRSAPATKAWVHPVAIPAAVAYHWSANGALIPQTMASLHPLSATASSDPAGNPDGGSWFSIWQPGVFGATWERDASQRPPSLSQTWRTTFAAWSPDGRYLVEGIHLKARLKPQETTDAGKQADCLSRYVGSLSYPDTALPGKSFREVGLAWRPDGEVLAVYIPEKGITLYRCSDGSQLASFALSEQDTAVPADAIVLRWSDDGTHLLFCSAQGHLVILTPVGERART